MSGLKLHVDVYTTEKGIIRVELKKSPVFSWTQHGPAFQEVDLWLESYAAKKELPELPFDYSMVSEFSKKVLIEMQKISFGKTQSYKELGQAVNCKSARAIGRACAMNPIPLFIPCHRVIGSNGKLTGFAYGVDMKEELLVHEGKLTGI